MECRQHMRRLLWSTQSVVVRHCSLSRCAQKPGNECPEDAVSWLDRKQPCSGGDGGVGERSGIDCWRGADDEVMPREE